MTAYRILAFVAWTWIAIGVCAFVAHVLIHEVGAPQWLPLPWSRFADFAESADGSVYVSIPVRRVLCYDAQGRFLASYRAPYSGTSGARLASDLKGRIFCLGFKRLWVRDGSWRLLRDHRVRLHRTWRLDGNSEVEQPPSQPGVAEDVRTAGPE